MNNPQQYKIPRVAEEFGLHDIEDELVENRTREGNPASLRKLAASFNQCLLQTVMEEAGMEPLEGEAENTYRLLTDDTVSSSVRTETEKKLEQNGRDIDHLMTSFVAYQAVRSYLKEVRDIESVQQDNDDRVEKVELSVERLRNRFREEVPEMVTQSARVIGIKAMYSSRRILTAKNF